MTEQTSRTITTLSSTTESTFPIDAATPLFAWLSAKAAEHELRWLLLHAETGVVWGERHGNTLALSVDATRLHWNSLHQARLFGESGEVFVWPGPQGWQARLIHDGEGNQIDVIDERQMLWGNRLHSLPSDQAGFPTITEGSQGVFHAPPIGDDVPNERRRVRLLVRHYLGEDAAGVVRVAQSRLVKLLKPGEQ